MCVENKNEFESFLPLIYKLHFEIKGLIRRTESENATGFNMASVELTKIVI
jgi:hypothetical protein